MKDVVKSQPQKKQAGRRRKRRGNRSLYYLLIFLAAFFVVFILSRTVLFRIGELSVTGNSRYTAAQILAAGNLQEGKNMFGINIDRTEQRIKDALVYIEDISITRRLPDRLEVAVTEAQPFACCQYEGSRYAVISRSGRFLETEQANPRGELMQIYGIEPVEAALGNTLESHDPNKLSILYELLDAIDRICPGKITYIDITDRTDILIGYGGRIDIEFGSSLDYEYKLEYITAIIEDKLTPEDSGRIIYHSATAGASFITNEDLEAMEEDLKRRQEQSLANSRTEEEASDGEG